MSSLLLTLTFEQAGLLLYAKEFQQFVWEEEWKVLDMPYFYFRKYWIPICLNCNLIFYTFSLFHSGRWQWCITHNFYLGTFVHEIFCLKEFGRRPWKSSKASYYLELLLYLYCLHSSALYMSSLIGQLLCLLSQQSIVNNVNQINVEINVFVQYVQ